LIDQTPTPQKRKGAQYYDEAASTYKLKVGKLNPMEPLVKASFTLFRRMVKKAEGPWE
jgi:hypothetical protein